MASMLPDPVDGTGSSGARHGLQGLAGLAFGSLSRYDDATQALPLGLLRMESLELDLEDPAQREFGDYELLERIGEGGMGVVYRAHQRSLDREVALKLLSAGPWASRDFIARFEREAQNAARMQHPNIVTVYEVGTFEGLQFFSMRLVRGESLSSKLKRGERFSPKAAATLMRTVAEAVGYAHSLGVLHLDLKPANILLDEVGTPYVADFGLARRLDNAAAIDNDEVSGTPSYMAPEQAEVRACKLAAATDIWGQGAILYEILTGRPPFRSDTARDTVMLVREGQIRAPRRWRPSLSLDLQAIVLRCLSKDPAERYANARELADDLARYVEGRPVHARPLNVIQRIFRWTRREPRLVATALLAFGLLVIGLAATTQQWRRADANAHIAQTNADSANERLWAGRREAAIGLMRGGRGFEALGPLLENVGEQEHVGRTDLHGIERREIGMILKQGVTLIDRMIVPDATPLASSLSTDGSMLALALSDFSIRWYDTATLTERGRVDVSGLPTSDGSARLPRLLRFIDNHRLLVTLDWYDYLASPSYNDTCLVDLDRGSVLDFPGKFKDPAGTVFSADGKYALLRDRRDQVQLWQVAPWLPLSAPVPTQHSTVWSAFLGRSGRWLAEKKEDADGYLTLRDPRGRAPGQKVGLSAAVSAWAENGSGSLLAIGDARGRVYLVDPVTRVVRQLPTPSGREVTWIAFSEDDAWVAAVRWDGAVFAFDVASGDPLNAGQMQSDFEPHEVAINRRERVLVAAGLGKTAIWRLPEPSPNALEATRLIASPTGIGEAGTNAVGISLGSRLVAGAGMKGEVRLWRLPGPAGLSARLGTDALMSGNLHFDGARVPDVAWNHVRVVTARGAPVTRWHALPHPVLFAELAGNGKTLIVVSGSALYVLDAATMKERIPPVRLRASPMHLAANAEGTLAILGYGRNDPTGFDIDLEAVNLTTGALEGHARSPGPLRQFELSPDGGRLLASQQTGGTTSVYDSRTLQRIGAYRHDPARPVTWSAFVPGSEWLWLLARDANDSIADDADLIAWNPRTGATRDQRHVAGIVPVGVATLRGKPLLAARDRIIWDPGTKNELASELDLHGEATTVFAASGDGRLLAQFVGADVQLYDTATLSPVGPPLRSSLSAYALPVQLAFSPDDTLLLGGHNPWLTWPIAPDVRPVDELRTQIQALLPVTRGRHVLGVPDATQRMRLRRNDPGPPLATEARPGFASARTISGLPIPVRDAAATPMQLDLTPAYNRPADLRTDMTSSAIAGYVGMRFGLIRLDGVDYDLRGAVELRTEGAGAFRRATGIGVPAGSIAAFHVLLFAPLAVPVEAVRDYAYVRLHYGDGSTVRLPIRTRAEVPGMTEQDRLTPIGWVRGDFLRQIGLNRLHLVSNPRLQNPHPGKRVVSLDLEAAAEGWSSPVFLAVTAEPVIAAATSGTSKRERPIHTAAKAPSHEANADHVRVD